MSGRKRPRGDNAASSSGGQDGVADHAALTNTIIDMDEDQAMEMYEQVCQKWCVHDPKQTHQEMLDLCLGNFGVEGYIQQDESGSWGMEDLNKKMKKCELECIGLYGRLKELDLLDDQEVSANIRKCIEILFYARKVVASIVQCRISVDDTMVISPNIEDQILTSLGIRFRWIEQDLSEYQQLRLFMLDTIHQHRYRKQGDSIFEEVKVDGKRTHAWRRVSTIKEFIYKNSQKEMNFDAFFKLTNNGRCANTLVEYLENCYEPVQFPALEKDRTVFSFKDGIYLAETDSFYTYEDAQYNVPISVVSSNYFESDFGLDSSCGYDDIETPVLDSLFMYQGYEPDAIRIFYSLLGRMLYDVNIHDGWQVCIYILGLAATGKSTIINNVIGKIYDPVDTGVLSNNVEKQFGLSGIYDKNIWIAGEVKSDWQLEQGEFQQMCSGEKMTVAIKNKTPFSFIWKACGALAGNEIFNFNDNAGSIQRRIVLFRFETIVKKSDSNLDKKLLFEMPKIIVKANKAYRKMASEHGTRSIYEQGILPKVFIESRDRTMSTISVVDSFMRNAAQYDENSFETISDFAVAIRLYSSETGRKTTANTDNLVTSLAKYNIRTKRREVNNVTVDVLEGLKILPRISQGPDI